MKVKLKYPNRVYYDKEQRLSFAGKKVIETKATAHVRMLLRDGFLIEVAEAPKEEVSPSGPTEPETKGGKVPNVANNPKNKAIPPKAE